MKVYIVTGAVGHLASTTIKRLSSESCKIRGLILPSEKGTDSNHITYYKGDITKPETLDAIFSGLENDEVTVLHIAGLISIQRKTSPSIYNVNVNGTKNIIRKCFEYNINRLVYVSSVHAIPELPKGTTIEEVDSFSPNLVVGAYAKTKAEASQAVLDAGKNGLNTVIVHPSGIIGPGDKGNNHVSQLLQMYLNHKLPCGVKGGYDFVDVRDVADGIVRAAEKGRNGECYLLSNKYISVKELLELMRLAVNRKHRIICCELWIAKAATPFIELFSKVTKRRPLFTLYSLNTMNSNAVFSHKKASSELGYKPRPIQQTINDTIEFIKL